MSVECFATGGTGFVGQHLVAHLSAKGHTIRGLMRRPERLAALRDQVASLGGDATRVSAVLAIWNGTTSG